MDILRKFYVALTWKVIGFVFPFVLIINQKILPNWMTDIENFWPELSHWLGPEGTQLTITGAVFLSLVQIPIVLWRKWFWRFTHPRLDFSGQWKWKVEWEKESIPLLRKEMKAEAEKIKTSITQGSVIIKQDALLISIEGGNAIRDTTNELTGSFATFALTISDDGELRNCLIHKHEGWDYVVVDQVQPVITVTSGLSRGRPLKLEGRFPFISRKNGMILFGFVTYTR